VPAQPVDATPSDTNLHLKGGVYDPSEAREAFRDAENRAVESLEGRTVVAWDWAGPGQGPRGHSLFVGASWWDCADSPSTLGANTHTGGAGRYLSRDRFRLVDSCDSQRSAASCIDGESSVLHRTENPTTPAQHSIADEVRGNQNTIAFSLRWTLANGRMYYRGPSGFLEAFCCMEERPVNQTAGPKNRRTVVCLFCGLLTPVPETRLADDPRISIIRCHRCCKEAPYPADKIIGVRVVGMN